MPAQHTAKEFKSIARRDYCSETLDGRLFIIVERGQAEVHLVALASPAAAAQRDFEHHLKDSVYNHFDRK
jgi:hypothetical protein